MTVQPVGAIAFYCLLLLLLLFPQLLLAQEYYSGSTLYIRPELPKNVSCPVKPCLTPSQLRAHYSACSRVNSCQTDNTSLVLLPGIHRIGLENLSLFPSMRFLLLAGYDNCCDNACPPTAIINCGGAPLSIAFQTIRCVQFWNCIAFTGQNTTVTVVSVLFNDTLIRLASFTLDDHSNYTLGYRDYCLLKQNLSSSMVTQPSKLTLRNVSFTNAYDSTCATEHGIMLTTVVAVRSIIEITDCSFSQLAVNHISLHDSKLQTSGKVHFENANTAIAAEGSRIVLNGVVSFANNENSAIKAPDTRSTITLIGTVRFINNTAHSGGAIEFNGSLTMGQSAQVLFQGNHADYAGGAISNVSESAVILIAGTVNFTANSAERGGAIASAGHLNITDSALVNFLENEGSFGGAIFSRKTQCIDLAGTVHFLNNFAHINGGAIDSGSCVTTADNSRVLFQDNHANRYGGAIYSFRAHSVVLQGTVQFINNTATQGGAIDSEGAITTTDNSQVTFESNNVDKLGGAIFSMAQIFFSGIVCFINNGAKQGGAINCESYVIVSKNAQVIFQGNNAVELGGAVFSSQNMYVVPRGVVHFTNNTANQGGAIHFEGDMIHIYKTAQVIFEDNRAITFGGAIFSYQHSNISLNGLVHFINNTANQGGAIDSTGNITIVDGAQVLFQYNHADYAGGAIVCLHDIILSGNVSFINNSAYRGGAITIIGSISVTEDASVVFQDNSADHVGGAILSTKSDISYIFISNEACPLSVEMNSRVEMVNNTANDGGSAMYSVCAAHEQNDDYDYMFNIITINPDTPSAVSSDPLRACICPDQSTPDCLAILPEQNIPYLHYTVYPGQNFTIPAAVVGYNFALTSGSIHAQFLNSEASLGSESQYIRGVSHTGCSKLLYSVLSENKQEILVLTIGKEVDKINYYTKQSIEQQNQNSDQVNNPPKYFANKTFATNLTDGIFRVAGSVATLLVDSPVFVTVTLLNCPLGFDLSGRRKECDCNRRIKNILKCNITDQTIRRQGTIWINASYIGNTSNGVIIHKLCPFEYCKSEQLDVNLIHPEVQCAFNRCGILCGACKTGLSLALGSSQCLSHCSNKYLSLLIPFALAGFALVFFIKILNLTVSQGTISGLIFYANIVAANRSILFPVHHNSLLSFLSIFISWLNLDIGIETCFIKALDSYWKTWLEFVFPFYVWAIAGCIILASHYSSRATKVFGNNSLPVLATLFYLSYGKLIQCIITIFSFTTLVYPDESTSAVWAFDGNIRYLSPKHIPLFIIASAISLLLWLPYTAILLCAKWLRTQTHRKHLHWLKPFLDAYYGPIKDQHHYWVGILLVVRGVLFACFASFFAVENNMNLLLTIITSFVLSAFPGVGVYKLAYLSFLENSFFLNLGVLAAGTLYIRHVNGDQETLVTTSIAIAFIQFIGISAYHACHFVIIPVGKKCHYKVKSRAAAEHEAEYNELHSLHNVDSSDSESEDRPRPVVTYSEVSLADLHIDAGKEVENNHKPLKVNGKETADHQVTPDQDLINSNLTMVLTHRQPEITEQLSDQMSDYLVQIKGNQSLFNNNSHEVSIMIPFSNDTPNPNVSLQPCKAESAPKTSERDKVSLDRFTPQETNTTQPHCTRQEEMLISQHPC